MEVSSSEDSVRHLWGTDGKPAGTTLLPAQPLLSYYDDYAMSPMAELWVLEEK